MNPEIQELYGNKVRVRACGLLVRDDGLLMVNHKYLTAGDLWSPPGGGIGFGETARACLEREFYEETGLIIEVGDFLFACEFIRPPLHAVELFFTVREAGGTLITGTDPEMKSAEQLIQTVKFLPWDVIKNLPPGSRHGIFNTVAQPSDILRLNGYAAL